MDKKSLSIQDKKQSHLNIYNSMTTPMAEEDHVIWAKAPEQLVNGPKWEYFINSCFQGQESNLVPNFWANLDKKSLRKHKKTWTSTTPLAEEDHVIRSKALEQLVNGAKREYFANDCFQVPLYL